MRAVLSILAVGLACLIYYSLHKRTLDREHRREKGRAGDYSKVFPPLPPSSSSLCGAVELTKGSNLAESALHTLSIKSDYRLAEPSTYVFSGFTVGQIKNLGVFPDYAQLSGVPLPSALKEFCIENARPRPYRPFRWPYHQTMSFQKMDPNYWLELESSYCERVRQRRALVHEHGKSVMQCLPGSELACKELMEMAVQFLCARYPSHFQLDKSRILRNDILGVEYDLVQEDPLDVLLNNLPEDFAIMLRDEVTGRYQFRAGIICSSLGWNLDDKIGKGLSAIHEPVPKYQEKMEFSVDRFFTKLPTDSPIQRGSWSLEVGQPLYMPRTDPHMRLRERQDGNLGPQDIYLRVDWQTLRRLPLSGAVVFNFKALFTPLTALEREPYIPALLYKVLSDGEETLLKYKSIWHVEHVVKPTLEKYKDAQVAKGLVEADWHPRTLDQSPFYLGWDQTDLLELGRV